MMATQTSPTFIILLQPVDSSRQLTTTDSKRLDENYDTMSQQQGPRPFKDSRSPLVGQIDWFGKAWLPTSIDEEEYKESSEIEPAGFEKHATPHKAQEMAHSLTIGGGVLKLNNTTGQLLSTDTAHGRWEAEFFQFLIAQETRMLIHLAAEKLSKDGAGIEAELLEECRRAEQEQFPKNRLEAIVGLVADVRTYAFFRFKILEMVIARAERDWYETAGKVRKGVQKHVKNVYATIHLIMSFYDQHLSSRTHEDSTPPPIEHILPRERILVPDSDAFEVRDRDRPLMAFVAK
ncbi:hypothetical protein BJ508DRAFT_314154 [Ascobolus immersus RN42]|uniref:Uncharacterized protein n=1 Tax=Ascobolus immersus RN42 TaxID=1160509 RepID=A0A3N4HFY8_ASCIM|nr:hypothetical protein BJ508DRAFT_314154 [Ascobolus immersus RN42]